MTKRFLVCLGFLVWAGVVPAVAGDLAVTGYVDGEFQAHQANTLSGDSEWGNSFGDNSHVVVWAGTEVSEDVSGLAELFYWQSSNTFTLEQAMIDWHIMEDQVVARFGKFYFPFGIEARSLYATTNKLVSRPNLAGWSDNGVAVHGRIPMSDSDMEWAYDVAFVNGLEGTGLTPVTVKTINNSKSVGGRLSFMPTPKFEVGGSGAFGKWDAAGENSYFLAGAHGVATPIENLDVRGEWAMSTLSKAAAGEDVTGMGFYAQAAYRLAPEAIEYVEPAVRFSWTDPNTDADDDETMQLAVGGTVSPVERLMFKAEFQLNMENSNPEPDNNAVLIQAVLGW